MTSYIATGDGMRLAVTESGDPAAPTVLLIHGFPDDHSVWDGVARALADGFHVVSYDVRGSGRSDRPRSVSAYRLDQLADDVARIIDAVSPGRAVHLVGHDWGSVQAWHAATDLRMRNAVASLTSISGPCLHTVPHWIGRQLGAGLRGWISVAGMWKSPLYMGALQTPILGWLLCRIGLVDAVIKLAHRLEVGMAPQLSAHRARENSAGLKIYTANLLPALLRPARRHTEAPVQVLAPRRDIFITPASQRDITELASHWQVHDIPGGHWAPAFNPGEVAARIRAFVDAVDAGTIAPTGDSCEQTA